MSDFCDFHLNCETPGEHRINNEVSILLRQVIDLRSENAALVERLEKAVGLLKEGERLVTSLESEVARKDAAIRDHIDYMREPLSGGVAIGLKWSVVDDSTGKLIAALAPVKDGNGGR